MKKNLLKKYQRFKHNNLPTPFFDKERLKFELILPLSNNIESYSDIEIYKSYESALSDLAYTGLYYPYTCKLITRRINPDTNEEYDKAEIRHLHSHNFEELLQDLYDYPESFSISSDDEKFYSTQELYYINNVKQYLLFIGLKDASSPKPSITRYRSKKQNKYGSYPIHHISNNLLNDILNNKVDYYITLHDGYNPINEDFKEGEFKALLVDENSNFKLLVELTKIRYGKYNDYKKYVKSDNSKDAEMVRISYFNIVERF